MYDGLKENSEMLRGLIKAEAELVGQASVVLIGLSQGCAIGLHTLLSTQSEASSHSGVDGLTSKQDLPPFGAFIGMSGWMPLARDLQGEAWPYDALGDDDPFADGDGQKEDTLLQQRLRAANFTRDICDLPLLPLDSSAEPSFPRIPVFLGHGTEDNKVFLHLGMEAKMIIERLEVPLTWKTYDFGHWWKEPEEINDIVKFLEDIVGMQAIRQD